MSAKTTQPPARPATSVKAAVRGGSPAGGTQAAPVNSVRTPWGKVDFTSLDREARDPLEPDAPITEDPPAGPRGPADGASATAPMSPRELYEMLITPAASPTRSSPLRINPTPRPAELEPAAAANGKAFPRQAEMVLSALEAGQAANPKAERRSIARRPYRVRATLRLFSDRAGTPGWTLYTRDVHSRGLGFITPHRLPLGYGGMVELPDPAAGPDATVRVPCTLLRCRETAPGWFEGSLYFNRDQPGLGEA